MSPGDRPEDIQLPYANFTMPKMNVVRVEILARQPTNKNNLYEFYGKINSEYLYFLFGFCGINMFSQKNIGCNL